MQVCSGWLISFAISKADFIPASRNAGCSKVGVLLVMLWWEGGGRKKSIFLVTTAAAAGPSGVSHIAAISCPILSRNFVISLRYRNRSLHNNRTGNARYFQYLSTKKSMCLFFIHFNTFWDPKFTYILFLQTIHQFHEQTPLNLVVLWIKLTLFCYYLIRFRQEFALYSKQRRRQSLNI
jgi:hypothetical protein